MKASEWIAKAKLELFVDRIKHAIYLAEGYDMEEPESVEDAKVLLKNFVNTGRLEYPKGYPINTEDYMEHAMGKESK